MRPIDLARAAGVTPQTVRNLEAQAVLPPAERSASGYRLYTSTHLCALRAYRALARAHGAPCARSIMVAITAGDPATGIAQVDSVHADLHAQRRDLDDLAIALHTVSDEQTSVRALVDRVSIGDLAEMLGVRTSALRVWEHAGLLSSTRDSALGYREYTEPQTHAARIIHLLRQGGYLFDRIRPVIDALNGAGSTDALTTAITDGRVALDQRARHAIRAVGMVDVYIELLEKAES